MIAALRRLFAPAPKPVSLTRTMRARLEGAKDRREGCWLRDNRYDRDSEAACWRAWRVGWRGARR